MLVERVSRQVATNKSTIATLEARIKAYLQQGNRDVAEACVGLLPIREIHICGDEDVVLVLLVVGLLASGQRRTERQHQPCHVRGTEFHDEAPLLVPDPL